MNKISCFVLIFSFCLFGNKVKSQYAIAGTPYATYFDIVPDTLIYSGPYRQYGDYYFDINQDGTNDIHIRTYYGRSPAIRHYEIRIFSLNTSTSFILGHVVSGSGGYDVILKMYDIQDTINLNTTTGTNGYLSVSRGLAGQYDYSDGTWINTGDKFFGVKYQDSLGVAFGWVKVNVPDWYTCLVKEYSLNYSTVSSVPKNDVINPDITIFPNPGNGQVTVSGLQLEVNTANLMVNNVFGQDVYQTKVTDQQIQIDLSQQPKGVYFIKVQNGNYSVVKKVVVQ